MSSNKKDRKELSRKDLEKIAGGSQTSSSTSSPYKKRRTMGRPVKVTSSSSSF